MNSSSSTNSSAPCCYTNVDSGYFSPKMCTDFEMMSSNNSMDQMVPSVTATDTTTSTASCAPLGWDINHSRVLVRRSKSLNYSTTTAVGEGWRGAMVNVGIQTDDDNVQLLPPPPPPPSPVDDDDENEDEHPYHRHNPVVIHVARQLARLGDQLETQMRHRRQLQQHADHLNRPLLTVFMLLRQLSHLAVDAAIDYITTAM